jgi:phosphoribosyl-ATP pyrophosphohydrolase/phosphoribosyl-AMP cyclohydrolase
LVIASKNTDNKLFIEESADLLFHFLLILQKKGFKINDVIKELKTRNK